MSKKVKVCPKCGYENPVQAKYCINCGYNLTEVSPMEKVSLIPVYISVSTVMAIIYLLDILFNYVFRALFELLVTIRYVLYTIVFISIVGIVIILYSFIKRHSKNKVRIAKFSIVGNILTGSGGFMIFIIPAILGRILVPLYWVFFLVIGYLLWREIKEVK